MAVAFDAVSPSSSGQRATAGVTLSWTHTAVASGVGILVQVSFDGGNGNSCSCTCDSIAMTQLGQELQQAIVGTYVVLFGTTSFALASGSHTIAFTGTGANAGDLEGASISFTGAASWGSVYAGTNTSLTQAVTLTSTTSGNMVAGLGSAGNTITAEPATERWLNNVTGGGGSSLGCASGSTVASTGSSMTLNWTNTSSADSWAAIAVEVVAAAAGGSGVPYAEAEPGEVWLRHFMHRQEGVAAPVGVPAVNLPSPPPALEPGVTWRRHFQHPQEGYLPAQPPSYSLPSGITGAGTLSDAGSKASQGASGITAAGSLADAGTKAGKGTTAITGAGSLQDSGHKNAISAETITAAGSLTDTGSKASSAAGTVTAAGALGSTGTVVTPIGNVPDAQPGPSWLRQFQHRQQPQLPPTAPSYAAPAALSAAGALADTGAKADSGASAITGAAALASPGVKHATGASALSAAGTLSDAGVKHAAGTTTLAAAGALAGAGSKASSGTTAVTAAGTVNGSGQPPLTAGIAQDAAPGITWLRQFWHRQQPFQGAALAPSFSQPSNLAGAGSLADAGFKAATGTSSVTGAGAAADAGHKNVAAAAALTAAGTLADAGHKAATSAQMLAAAGTLQDTGSKTATAAGAVTAAGALQVTSVSFQPAPPAVQDARPGPSWIRRFWHRQAILPNPPPAGGAVLSQPLLSGAVTTIPYAGTVTTLAYAGTITPASYAGTTTVQPYGGTVTGGIVGVQSDLTAIVGNDVYYYLALTYSGAALNLTGYTVKAYLKATRLTPDSDAVVYTSGSGLTITSVPGGLVTWDVPHANLPNPSTLWYRVDVIDASLEVFTALYGNLQVQPA